jgi:hypothetical protein
MFTRNGLGRARSEALSFAANKGFIRKNSTTCSSVQR